MMQKPFFKLQKDQHGRLGLQIGDDELAFFYLDFLSPKMHHRKSQASRRTELLIRAIGLKATQHPTIIDATAGFGRDSFILASKGFNVTMIERHDIVFALLNDAIQRALHDPQMKTTMQKLTLINADTNNYLKTLSTKPQVIYLDPMFPERKKSALVKKEMVILQTLLKDTQENPTQLFEVALSCATDRVVVKRPRLASTITQQKPSFNVIGKSSRFDVYLTKGRPSNAC